MNKKKQLVIKLIQGIEPVASSSSLSTNNASASSPSTEIETMLKQIDHDYHKSLHLIDEKIQLDTELKTIVSIAYPLTYSRVLFLGTSIFKCP